MKNYSNNIKSFQEVLEEFEFTFKKFSMGIEEINRQFLNNVIISSNGNFYGYSTYDDFIIVKKKAELELNRKFIVDMVTSFEAKIVYYFRNVLKRKSPMGDSYRRNVAPSVRQGHKQLMYQHIKPVFKEIIQPIDNTVYLEFLNLVTYRNWLVHGRSSELPNYLENYTFQNTWRTIESILNLLPDYPESLKE